MLKLVPFNSTWITHEKIDVKAIYRRPRFVEDAYGEMIREVGPDGLPTWDLTGPLPVKSHNKYDSKGFKYVTLADRDSLHMAAKHGTIENWRDYVQDPRTGGPWHYRKYVEGQEQAQTAEAARLLEMIDKYGPELVEDMRRESEPGYVLPAELRTVKRGPGRPRKAEAVSS